MYKIIVTQSAHQDIEQAVAYIAKELQNPVAAANLLHEIDQCYERLATMPEMYSFCSQPTLARKGYRKAVVGNYLLLYRVEREQECVYVMRFPYGKRDLQRII